MAPACRACLQILCIFWSKCLKGTFHLKFFPPIFLGLLFAGMLNSRMSVCAVWLHAVSCSFSLQQRAFSCMPRPSCRLASSAPCAVRQSLRRRACPARSVQPRPAPCRPRQPRPSSPSPVLALALARVRQRQPSAVCASVPAVRQPSAHQATPVMPAVRLRQIKPAPVNGMAGPPMHRGSASYGLTGRQLYGMELTRTT